MGKKRRRAKDAGALDALSWTKVDEPSHAGFEMDEAGFNDLEEVDGDSVDVIETAPGVWEIRPKESTSSMLTGSSARANAATSTAAAGHQDAHLPDDNMTASSDVGSSRAGLTEKQKRLQAVVQERRERKRKKQQEKKAARDSARKSAGDDKNHEKFQRQYLSRFKIMKNEFH